MRCDGQKRDEKGRKRELRGDPSKHAGTLLLTIERVVRYGTTTLNIDMPQRSGIKKLAFVNSIPMAEQCSSTARIGPHR